MPHYSFRKQKELFVTFLNQLLLMFEFSKPIEIHFSMAESTASKPLYCHLHTYSQFRRTYHLKSGQEALKEVLAGIR